MPVIKTANSESVARNAIVLDLGDLTRQGEEIIERARAEAERIRNEAEAEAAALVAAADERGFAQGEQRGLEAGRETGRTEGREEIIAEYRGQLEALGTAWQQALEAWEQGREAMLRDARTDVLALALALTRKIVLRVPTVEPAVIEDQLAAALALMNKPSALAIRVHPEDRAQLVEVLPELLERFATCAHAELEEDPGLARGGCVVESGRGEVDATLETQLERMCETLLPPSTEAAP